ncbi:MAG: 6-carboxytetrahydropterin synthase QueD [Gemmatimonadetes bacterium]|nr:6-carboxytetrahydropterin synthase QueD [Gemmatimonadota bacterium]MBI3568607.1 6-carboxytetrahydropterin synthase QueD [Gemmatimonadota bacterium]
MAHGHTEAFCEFTFAAGRRLTGVGADHPCARVHGHTFLVRVSVQGPVDPLTGFVADFADLRRAWAPVHEALDHRFLNDVAGLENPTSEHIARWIWERLATALPALASIEVRETGNNGVVFRG